MEKRYQVFVSSTFNDLREERAEVMQALLEMDCIPAGMEIFPASQETQWDLIKRVIDDCDYYLLIIGGRYGSVGEEGISFTEKEFDYAVEKGMPIMVFPIEDPGKVIVDKAELSEKGQARLKAFREKAMDGRMAKMWTSSEGLAGKVSRSLNRTITLRPAEGWVRGRYAGDSEAILRLKNRIEELETEVETTTTTPPIGSENLSQGQDHCFIDYSVFNHVMMTTNHRQASDTWDNVIGVVGPLMFVEASELQLRNALGGFLCGKGDSDSQSKTMVAEDSFQTIKIQLMALGIIQKSERKRTPSDKETYWSLTPYGAHYVTKLKAVQR